MLPFLHPCSSGSGSSTRSEKRDKMLIYIRLFLGMGITWFFEIITFGLSSLEPDPRWLILTDTLNMCQVLSTRFASTCINVINQINM